jgi:hypothetical protein
MQKLIIVLAVGLTTILLSCDPPSDCCNNDSPNCPCFVNNTNPGAWNPSGTWIQDVARLTLGTRVSCNGVAPGVHDAGQPYYQMRLGMNGEDQAQILACVMEALPEVFDSTWGREAWCSETVSYWHRQNRIPYDQGYRNSSWHLDWQLTHSGAVRSFYAAEEDGGRGRWIDAHEVNLGSIVLGENAPLPGAYIRIKAYDITADTFFSGSAGRAHSLMVDSLTIYRDPTGRIHRVDARFLEGNSGSPAQVSNARRVESVLECVPGGPRNFDSNRKIYGFGIDLDPAGNPIFDPSRIDTIAVPPPLALRPVRVVDYTRAWEEIYHASKLKEILAYRRRVKAGPKVTSNYGDYGRQGLPDGQQIRWALPSAGPDKPLEITIDLLAEHPLPIRGLSLQWTKDKAPTEFRVLWAGRNRKFQETKMPKRLGEQQAGSVLLHPVSFGSPAPKVRFVKLIFPNSGTQNPAVLDNLYFKYDWGADDDALKNPLLPKQPKGA